MKSYSGPKSNPHIFTIIAKNKERQEIARKDIEVFASPKVEKAYWSNSHSEIEKAFINSDIYVHIEGKGLYKKPLTLKIFTEKEQEIITREIQIYNLIEDIIVSLDYSYGLGFFSSFFGKILLLPIDKIFFVLEDREGNILYRSNYLRIIKNFFTRKSEEKIITPVVIYDEEYFTQRYEPCKYESISYAYGKEKDILFKHGEPTKKKKNNYNINIITGNDPKGQKLEITLGGVDTRECEYNDKNRIYTVYSSIDNKEFEEQKYKDHKGNIFDKQVLLDNGIINEENKENILKFVPKYPYPKDDWEFLKQSLFGEAISKTIAINTCRYKRKITLNVFPDVLWTFHSKFGYEDDYFFDERLVNDKDTFLVTGIDSFYNLAQEYIQLLQINFGWIKYIDRIVDIIAKEAQKVSYGLHIWYNNKKESIDYTKNYQKTTEFFIFQSIIIKSIIEIILIIITRGKGGGKIFNKIRKISKNKEQIEDFLGKMNMEITYPAVAMNSASYYEKQKDGRVAQIVEFNIKADPLIGVKYQDTLELNILIANQILLGNKDVSILEKLSVINLESTISIGAEGTLSQEYNLKINTLTNQFTITPIIGNYLIYNRTTFTQKNTISIFAEIKGISNIRIDNFKGELKAMGNAKGIISHSRSYGKDEKGIWIQDILTLSKVKGKYMINSNVVYKGRTIYKNNPLEKDTSFTLLEGRIITLPKTYLLKT